MGATNMACIPPVGGANTSTGSGVLMSPFSGPNGSPFADVVPSAPLTGAVLQNSTGALCTGIGFGITNIIGLTAPASIVAAGFNDNYIPGNSYFSPAQTTMQTMPTAPVVLSPPYAVGSNGTGLGGAVLTTIVGGKSEATLDGVAPTVPYDSQPLLNFGNGGSRDAGAGPAHTGFFEKMVTATASVANGAAIETGFINRTGVTVLTGESAFGSSTAASPAVA